MRRTLRRFTLVRSVLALAALTVPAASLAAQHLMAIQEVFVGTPSERDNASLTPNQRAQYVMLRMTSSAQTLTLNTALRVEDAAGNILGNFGVMSGNVTQGGSLGCAYPNCPAIVIGTQAAKNLFTFAFDQIVDAQAGRVALPAGGGRVCFTNGTTSVFDCVAWGNFSCTAANCPGGANAYHAGDLNGNLCATSFGTPIAPAGLEFGKSAARKTFNCATKANATDFALAFPKPVNNAGANNNTDTDADGLIDQLDCKRNLNTILWKPIEVTGQRLTGHATSTDQWDSQSSFAGSGVKYDESRGTLSHLSTFSDDTCHAPGSTTTSATDANVPPAGDGFYYVVRATGGTGCIGTYGSSTAGASRDASLTSCP